MRKPSALLASALRRSSISPFTSTGNGYFACWLGLACASLWVYREVFEMQAPLCMCMRMRIRAGAGSRQADGGREASVRSA